MNIDEAVARACQEPTLLDALSCIAVWESERVVQQARRFYETRVATGSDGAGWDTCFKTCFQRVMEVWKKKEPDAVEVRKKERERCAKIARHATVRPYSFKIHPDMEFDWFPDNSKVVAHACAQGIAMEIERQEQDPGEKKT